jgi:ribosomal protein L37E
MNEIVGPTCQQLLTSFFKKYPNPHLQIEVNRILKRLLALKIPMPGKQGGWAGGIIYALANQYCRACGILIYALANQYCRPCGIPGLLNKESEEFFNVSIETIYRRARRIRELLVIT